MRNLTMVLVAVIDLVLVSPASPDLTVAGRVMPEWGLHLVDMDIAMGHLIDVVGQQARSWVSVRK